MELDISLFGMRGHWSGSLVKVEVKSRVSLAELDDVRWDCSMAERFSGLKAFKTENLT